MDLRKHQIDALEAITNMDSDKGRIVIPTGGGKTLVEAFALRDIINEDARDIHLVLAPRIALVNQLIKEYRSFIGQKYIAVAFHSGRHEPDFENVRWSETATTNPQLVAEEFARAKRMGKDLVVFSTYASAEKLTGFQFDTLIADESQYCVSENYFDVIRAVDATKKLFFTATERHTKTVNGRGLNNNEVFGDVVYQVAPQTLIDAGYIVAPRLHVMSADSKADYSVVDECIQIAKKQQELTSDMPVCKTLFAMKGTADVKDIIENVNDIKTAMPGFKVFTIVSNAKYGAMVDGEKMARGNFMKVLRETDNALIFHYDILSEGIDVDGITGVAILRNLKHAKLLQTIGRAVRIYKADPSKKQQAWVSVVAINGNQESMTQVGATIKAIREGGFDVNVEDIDITDNDGFGIADDDDMDALIGPDKKSPTYQSLVNVIHDIEQDEMFATYNSMSNEELLENF